jgi:hypothetical protein
MSFAAGLGRLGNSAAGLAGQALEVGATVATVGAMTGLVRAMDPPKVDPRDPKNDRKLQQSAMSHLAAAGMMGALGEIISERTAPAAAAPATADVAGPATTVTQGVGL